MSINNSTLTYLCYGMTPVLYVNVLSLIVQTIIVAVVYPLM